MIEHRPNAREHLLCLCLNLGARRGERVTIPCLQHRQVIRLVTDGEYLCAVPAHDREELLDALVFADAGGSDVEAACIRECVDHIPEFLV